MRRNSLSIARLAPVLRDQVLRFLAPRDIVRLESLRSPGATRLAAAAYTRRCGALAAQQAARVELLGEPPPAGAARSRDPNGFGFCAAVGRERIVAALLGDTRSQWEQRGVYQLEVAAPRGDKLGDIQHVSVALHAPPGGAFSLTLVARDSDTLAAALRDAPPLVPLFARYRAALVRVPPAPKRGTRRWRFETRRQVATLLADLLLLFADHLILGWRSAYAPQHAALLGAVLGPAVRIVVLP
jgi:hypothetical protein